MGHSLGAHVMSYVGKNISGIGRITGSNKKNKKNNKYFNLSIHRIEFYLLYSAALDPAKPGFQGKNASVRLDNSDAKFVDVIHTDGRNFIPFFGLGMSSSTGSVDFFINGGKIQPGCLFDGKKHKFSSILSTAKITMDGEKVIHIINSEFSDSKNEVINRIFKIIFHLSDPQLCHLQSFASCSLYGCGHKRRM